MKAGRKPVMRGVRKKDLRIRYVSLTGRTRGFYARWRPTLHQWECQLSGYGIKSRTWFSKSQTIALSDLQWTRCLWDWRAVHVDDSPRWDGVHDIFFDLFDYDKYTRKLPSSSGVPAVTPTASATRAAPVRPKGGVNSQGVFNV